MRGSSRRERDPITGNPKTRAPSFPVRSPDPSRARNPVAMPSAHAGAGPSGTRPAGPGMGMGKARAHAHGTDRGFGHGNIGFSGHGTDRAQKPETRNPETRDPSFPVRRPDPSRARN